MELNPCIEYSDTGSRDVYGLMRATQDSIDIGIMETKNSDHPNQMTMTH